MNAVLEVAGFVLIVSALLLISVPLGLGAAGVGLIVVANRPPAKQGSADADSPTVP